MFTTEELKNIDCTYFHIISAGCYCVTLQSRNTNHYWHIIHQQYPSFTTCKIQHKHKQSSPFHEQGTAPTLGQAIDKIKAHDFYHPYVKHKLKNLSDYWPDRLSAKDKPARPVFLLSFQVLFMLSQSLNP